MAFDMTSCRPILPLYDFPERVFDGFGYFIYSYEIVEFSLDIISASDSLQHQLCLLVIAALLD